MPTNWYSRVSNHERVKLVCYGFIVRMQQACVSFTSAHISAPLHAPPYINNTTMRGVPLKNATFSKNNGRLSWLRRSKSLKTTPVSLNDTKKPAKSGPLSSSTQPLAAKYRSTLTVGLGRCSRVGRRWCRSCRSHVKRHAVMLEAQFTKRRYQTEELLHTAVWCTIFCWKRTSLYIYYIGTETCRLQ